MVMVMSVMAVRTFRCVYIYLSVIGHSAGIAFETFVENTYVMYSVK